MLMQIAAPLEQLRLDRGGESVDVFRKRGSGQNAWR
jgi:hypothetical protein